MNDTIGKSCDALLRHVVTAAPEVPGVVAMATNREGPLYEGAAGRRLRGTDEPMTLDSVFALFSMTKPITATACLQLVEEGRLDLDAPAGRYVAELGQVQVLEGFDPDGRPQLRAPKRAITTRMLMLHTAGFGSDVFNEDCLRLARAQGRPDFAAGITAALMTPLLFDPGERWEYGSSLDWVGLIIEAITGKRLGEVMAERIFAPLGMADTGFTLSPPMRARLACMHQRETDGTLTPLPDFAPRQPPGVQLGGQGLYGPAGDYCRFIRMWLNDGAGPHGQVLRAETVRMAEKNGLGELKIRRLPGVLPTLSNDAEFFPGLPKSWALGFMVNDLDAPTGRPAGALGWAGLANLFFWIDRRNGVGGVWATQILPFADPASLGGFMEFEAAVYRGVAQQLAA